MPFWFEEKLPRLVFMFLIRPVAKLFALPPDAQPTCLSCRKCILITVVTGLWFSLSSAMALADLDQRQSAAMNSIFGGQLLSKNVSGIRGRAARLPQDARYALLREWVLPDSDPASIRTAIDFVPAVQTSRDLDQVDGSVPGAERPLTSFDQQLVSPAWDLVVIAKQIGKLKELRDLAAARVPDSIEQQKQHASFQATVAIALGEPETANQALSSVMNLAKATAIPKFERGAEAIAVKVALSHPETLETGRELALLLYQQALDAVGPRSERWHRHVYSLKHQLAYSTEASEIALRNWFPVSRSTAETHGMGYPAAQWGQYEGNIAHTSSHDHDYLYYAVPLTGNFAVDADLTTFGYKDIHLSFGNHWAGPAYDLKSCQVGDFRYDRPPQQLDPPVSIHGDWMRARLTVANGIRTTSVNGQVVFTRLQPKPSDPWLAIHSPWYCNGAIKSLAITGNPEIPESIDLASSQDLPGWLSYFDKAVGPRNSNWYLESPSLIGGAFAPRADAKSGATGLLIGRRQPELAGTYSESLLRYHRPMREDGTIDYDFYWQDEQSEVHPVVGDVAFLVDSDGVKAHRITDGKFEATNRDPAATLVMPGRLKILNKPALRQREFNQLQLQLKGDVATLSVNQAPVAEYQLDGTNSRAFGLFHYSDRTEARVRRIVWRGDWPAKLPSAAEQELSRDPSFAIVAAGDQLPVVLDYDFTTGGSPAVDSQPRRVVNPDVLSKNFNKMFTVFDGGLGTDITLQSDGIHVTRSGAESGEGYLQYGIGPRLEIGGDFQVTATFAGLKTRSDAGGSGNCQLLVGLPSDGCRLYVRKFPGKGELQSSVFRRIDGETRFLFAESISQAASSGRLRLVRLGNKLHYLFAENEAEVFRMVDTQEVSTDDSIENGIRLIQETLGQGTSRIVWKRLVIHAERADSKSPVAPEVTIPELDRRRSELPIRRIFDFSTQRPLGRDFAAMGPLDRDDIGPQGLSVVSKGEDEWTSTGLMSKMPLQGDFDVTLTIVPLKMDLPRAKDDTAVMLQTEFSDDRRTMAEVKYALYPDDRREMQTIRRIDNADGKFAIQIVAAEPATTVRALRLARRGPFLHQLYRKTKDSPWTSLGGVHVGTTEVPPTFLRMHVHTGGIGRESRVRFQSLSIASEAPPVLQQQ